MISLPCLFCLLVSFAVIVVFTVLGWGLFVLFRALVRVGPACPHFPAGRPSWLSYCPNCDRSGMQTQRAAN